MKKVIDERLLNDPIKFAEIFAVKLWAGQRKMMRMVRDERRVAIASCHASGKTFAAAILALWFAASYDNARVIVVAPGWNLLKSVLFDEIHSLLARARYKLPFEAVNRMELRFGAGNLILGLSVADETRLRGQHSANLLLIVDEATGIAPELWPSVESALAGANTHLLLLGNPTHPTGYFADCFGRNRTLWSTLQIGAFETPNLQGTTLEELLTKPESGLDADPWPFLTPRRWTKEARQQWWNGSAENSPIWMARVMGQFPLASINQLFALSDLERARSRPGFGR